MKEFDGIKMLSVHDIAQELRVHRNTVNRYIQNGYIKPDYIEPPTIQGRKGAQYFKTETVESFLISLGIDKNYEPLLAPREAARILNISVTQLRSLINRGLIHPDVVLPAGTGLQWGERRFKLSTLQLYQAEVKKNKEEGFLKS